MKKTKIPLGDSFKKETNRIHLRRFFPYLHKTYRPLDKKELKSRATLTELFGEQETDYNKLKTVYAFQNI